MANTILVMHLIFFLFKDAYASTQGIAPQALYGVITGIMIGNGLPEAIVAGILTAVICKALFVATGKRCAGL